MTIVRVSARPNGKAAGPQRPLDWPYLTAVQRALRLAALGYPVVPSGSHSKNNRHPTVERWQTEATTDETKILGEWGNHWKDTVGVVVGAGDVWGIDWDEPAQFQHVLKLLPANTARVRSGGGGLHTYFVHDQYSRQKLAALNGAATVPGKSRDKAAELYAATPHSFLCPGTRHYRTGELYRWEHEGPPRPAPRKFIDALLQLPWTASAERDGAVQAEFINDNSVRIREDIDLNHVFAERGFEVVKMKESRKYISADKQAACPVAGAAHRSRSTWCLFYDPKLRSLRFWCASCKQGDTREVLQTLGVDVAAIEDTDFLQQCILVNTPIDEVLPQLVSLLRDDFFVHRNTLSLVTQYARAQTIDKRKPMFPAHEKANVIIPVNDLYVQEVLTGKKRTYRATEKGRLRVDAPLPWCRQVINSPLIAPHLNRQWRQLRMLARVPLLLPTGDVAATPGFHKESGVYMDFAEGQFAPLPRHPTHKDALVALEKFNPVFGLYPFVNADDTPRDPAKSDVEWYKTPSGAVVLSAILTVLAKPLLQRVPIVGISAPKPGYGKTDIVQSIAACTLGHYATTISYPDQREFDKSLLQVLERGDRIVLVDNVGHTFVSNELAMTVTNRGEQSKRILGVKEHSVAENEALYCVTGNQLRFGEDLARRRVIRARLDQDVEHPEQRNFTGKPDPPEYCLKHFEELAMAGLTILSAYLKAGMPEKPSYVGSYTDWNRMIRGCVLWLGCGDPWLTALGVAEDDPFYERDLEMLSQWYAHLGDRTYSLKDLEASHGALYAKLFGTDPKKSSATSVGMWLSKLDGDTKEGYRLVRRMTKGHGCRYSVQWRGKKNETPDVDYLHSDKRAFINGYVQMDRNKFPLTAQAIVSQMTKAHADWEMTAKDIRKLTAELGIELEDKVEAK